MIKRKTLFVILILSATVLHAQPWMQNMDTRKSVSDKGDFYLIQDAFNEYWQEREVEKGKGWQQYKRWEYFMEPRVYPNGNLSLPAFKGVENTKKSTSDMASWSSLGPFLVPELNYADRFSGAGRLNTVAFHPNDENIMYVGAPSGGIWKTTDGGNSWVSLGDGLESLGVSDIAINPDDPDILYIVTGDGDSGDTYSSGILKSTDGGNTWQTTSLSLELAEGIYFRRILIDPTDPDILWASSNEGLFRTDDGFNSYKTVRPEHFKDIEFNPGDPDIVYATKYDSGGKARILRFSNSGNTMTILYNGLEFNDNVNRVELAVTPDNDDVVYALASSSLNGGFHAIYKSSDQGNNWTETLDNSDINLLGWDFDGQDSGGQGWYDLSLAVDPNDENTVYVGGINIYKSTDGGYSFDLNAHWIGLDEIDYVHADHHMLTYSPVTEELFSCNDGGIYKSSDDGETWVDLSDGISILQIYKMSASQASEDEFVTGNQDNGSFYRLDGTWTEVTGADGMDNLVKADEPGTIITSYYYGQFWVSYDYGETFYYFGPEEERASGAWVTPIIPSASNPDHLYVGYKNLYKSTDFGESWINLTSDLSNFSNFRSISVSPSNDNYIYVSNYTTTYRTKDGGITWDVISDDLPEASIMSVAISPNNPEKIWLSLSGFLEGDKVYMSEDAGDTWVNFSDGLPNIPTNIIVSHANHNGALYLGTDHGVYYRDDSKSSWELFNNGLPNVIVNDIEFQDDYDRVVIGTYGRGLWESPFYPQDPGTIYGEIYPVYQYACLDEPAKFYMDMMSESDSIVWNFNDESSLTLTDTDTAEVSFSTAGYKDIYATLYSGGNSSIVSLENYFYVRESVSLEIGSTDISDYHAQDAATLFASGANTYEWTVNTDYEISDPSNSSITVMISDPSTFYVTGRIGSCEAKDSISIAIIPGPDNDMVCDAIALDHGMNGPFSNIDASFESGEPLPDTTDCNTQYTWCSEQGLQNSVWFTYVAEHEVTSFITEGFDTQIALYKAETCEDILNDNYILIAANDDYFGQSMDYAAAIDNASLEIGTKYWIQIDGSAGGDEGTFTLLIQEFGVGIEDEIIDKGFELGVYPNPSTGDVTIQYLSDGESRLEIFDLNGRKIVDKTISNTGFIEENITVADEGIYILRVKTDDRIYNRKLVIE